MTDRNLYLECYSGISGDMTVAALLDLGANKDKLLETLKELKIDNEFEIKISKVLKAGIQANDFDVILKTKHNHEHRNLNDVYKIIDRLSNSNIKDLAKRIFKVVADAESKVHGKSIEEVYFHEVGAVDSIIDIVSVAFCIVDLNIKNVYVSTLYEGSGFVHCAHGDMPVPVPAVLNIIKEYNLLVKITNHDGELITPTGAAIVATLKNKEKLPDEYKILQVGLGAGKKYPDKPSILRAMLIEEEK
jgi:hypothetical protein